ncbi:sensor histidine kinase [Nocardia asteroides]|uniref:sensor histidine kinase n=1 Tax=Nocardia asteroides TaxID=1824 RepID=UPI001E63073A|nr:sensor histidine kinase [Nocardia asteroides]UGT62920.1 sensor histidine kinase [Nocardia asteroides]
MRRFSLWVRDNPVVADSVLALGLFLLDLTALQGSTQKPVFLVFALLLPLPVVVRRVYPRTAALALFVLSQLSTGLSGALGDHTLHPSSLGLGLALYTLVAYVGRRQGLFYLALLLADGVSTTLVLHQDPTAVIAFTITFYALCWTLAEFTGARHAYDTEVQARLAVADYDRERRAHDAVAAERTRIARELHDVVAHTVSVMIVQADGARYTLRRDPDAAERALGTIAGTGRDALRELRRTVALLRTEHAPDDLPQHGTAGIARVVAMMRDTGLAVDLELSGELDDVPPEVSLGVHRVVQEALTNTLRHAGAHPKAWVTVRRTGDRVYIEVVDTGGVPVHTAITGSGLGLVGMRERIAVLGGVMAAGREPSGRWRVAAELPVHRETP